MHVVMISSILEYIKFNLITLYLVSSSFDLRGRLSSMAYPVHCDSSAVFWRAVQGKIPGNVTDAMHVYTVTSVKVDSHHYHTARRNIYLTVSYVHVCA